MSSRRGVRRDDQVIKSRRGGVRRDDDGMKPRAEKGRLCPFWRKDMALVCHKCPLWTHLRGKNPQSEQEIDEWGCAVAWLPLLLVEGAQQTRQAGAAIESFRNEMVRLNEDRGQMTEDGQRLAEIIPPSVVRRLSSD